MTDHLEPFNGFGSENPSFKHFLNNLFENSHIMGGIFGILMKSPMKLMHTALPKGQKS